MPRSNNTTRDALSSAEILAEADRRDIEAGLPPAGVDPVKLARDAQQYTAAMHRELQREVGMQAPNRADKIVVKRVPMEWFTEEPPSERFAIEAYAPRKAVTLLVAAGGVGKSLTALYISTKVCSGQPFAGCKVYGKRVVYLTLEDDTDRIRARLYRTVNPQERKAVVDNLSIIDRYGIETHVVINANGEAKLSPIPDKIIEALRDEKPDVLFVDTLVRSHSVNENDNAQMGVVLVAYERIAKALDCAVILLHHIPKAAVTDKKALNSHLARGAGSITDNARSSLILMHATRNDVDGLILPDPSIVDREKLIMLIHGKHNYSAKEPTKWLEMTDTGAITECTLFADSRSEEMRLYAALYKWWNDPEKGDRAPVSKNRIREQIAFIRPKGGAGINKYQAALSWAIDHGYATETDSDSRNPNAKFYTLEAPPPPEREAPESWV